MKFFNVVVKNSFVNYYHFSGRASRTEYWFWILFCLIFYFASAIVDKRLGIAFWLIVLVPSIAVTTRRLHDVNRSGWWQLLSLTGIGYFLLLYWLCKSGDQEPNRFDLEIQDIDHEVTSLDFSDDRKIALNADEVGQRYFVCLKVILERSHFGLINGINLPDYQFYFDTIYIGDNMEEFFDFDQSEMNFEYSLVGDEFILNGAGELTLQVNEDELEVIEKNLGLPSLAEIIFKLDGDAEELSSGDDYKILIEPKMIILEVKIIKKIDMQPTLNDLSKFDYLDAANDEDVVASLQEIEDKIRERGILVKLTGDNEAGVTIVYENFVVNGEEGFYLLIKLTASLKKKMNENDFENLSNFVKEKLADAALGWSVEARKALEHASGQIVLINDEQAY